jgi:hypothetical protein
VAKAVAYAKRVKLYPLSQASNPPETMGIEKGKAFNPDAKTRAILDDAAKEARAWLETKYQAAFSPAYFDGTGWAVPGAKEVMEGMSTQFANPDSYPIDGRGLRSSAPSTWGPGSST